MFDPDGSGKGKSVRSLLSLAGRQKAAPASPRQAAPSLVSIAAKGPDPQAVHRAARSRREAQPNALLKALASKAEQPRRPAADREPSQTPARKAPSPQPAAAPEAPVRSATPRDDAYWDNVWSDEQIAHAASNDHWDDSRDDGQWKPLFDPAKIIGGVIKSRYIILATTVAGAALGVMIAMSMPKTYTSVTDIQIDPRDIKVFDRNLTEGGLPSDATLAIVENQVRVITSGTVIDKVVEKLNLEADPEFNGSQKSFGLSSIFSELRSILSRSEPSSGERRAGLVRQHIYEGLRVERAGKTFIVSIAMTTQDREKSALIANTIAQTFMTSYAGLQSDTAGKASEGLTSRLAELRREVEAAERKVEAYQAEHELIDAKGGLISDDELIRLNDQLTIARARTLELNARASTARDLDLNSVLGGGLPEGLASPVISDLRAQYSAARQALDGASVRLGPRHPQRQAAEAELAGVRNQISNELRRLVSSIQVDLKRAVQLEQDLAARLAQLKAKQGNVGENLVDLRELQREAAAKRAVYENFLLRARETGEQSGINTANVSVISPAQPPLDANGPSRSMVSLLGMILGFLTGIGLGVLRGAWDSMSAPRPEGTRPPRQPLRARWRASSQDDRFEQPAQDRAAQPRYATAQAAQPVATAQSEPVEAAAQPVMRAEPAQPAAAPVAAPSIAPEPVVMAAAPPQPVANQNWAVQPQPAFVQPAMMQPQPAMQPVYVPQQPIVYPQHPPMQPWQSPAHQMPQPYAPPHQFVQPQPYIQPQYVQPQPYMQPQQYAPQPMSYAPPLQQAYAPQFATPQYAAPQTVAPQPAVAQPAPPPAQSAHVPVSAVDEIRSSLREFRDAVNALAQTRVRAVR